MNADLSATMLHSINLHIPKPFEWEQCFSDEMTTADVSSWSEKQTETVITSFALPFENSYRTEPAIALS
jgi:hypothetical protein